MLPQRTSVLIIGAGPTGLATAISLINQGCHDITIVDAALTNLNSSRAMTIHAATLEVWKLLTTYPPVYLIIT